MVANLEQVDGRQHLPTHERCLHRRLGVAGENRRESTVPNDHDNRSVVDVALGQWGRGIGF